MMLWPLLLVLLTMSHAAEITEYPGQALFDYPLGPTDYPLQITLCGSITNVDLEDMSVGINMTHTWVADLRVSVIAPSGEKILCFDKSWGSKRNLDITFKDSAPSTPGDVTETEACPTTGSSCVGEYRCQEGNFSQFSTNGTNRVGGLWVIRIADFVSADTGFFYSYTISFPNTASLGTTRTPTSTPTSTPILAATPKSTLTPVA